MALGQSDLMLRSVLQQTWRGLWRKTLCCCVKDSWRGSSGLANSCSLICRNAGTRSWIPATEITFLFKQDVSCFFSDVATSLTTFRLLCFGEKKLSFFNVTVVPYLFYLSMPCHALYPFIYCLYSSPIACTRLFFLSVERDSKVFSENSHIHRFLSLFFIEQI